MRTSLNAERPWWQEVLLVFLLVFPSCIFGNEYISLLLPVALVWFHFDEVKANWKNFKSNPFSREAIRYFWLLAVFMAAALANKVFNGDSIVCAKDYYAPFMLLPFLLLAGRYAFSRRTFKVFLVFVSVEIAFAAIQYLMNDRSLILPLTEETTIKSKALLYDSRVYGFTANSSIFGMHILVAFFFLVISGWRKWRYAIVFAVLLAGMFLSFNRTVVIMVVGFFILQTFETLWLWWQNRESKALRSQFNTNLILVVVLLIILFSPFIKNSLLRGGKAETLDYSIEYSFDTIPLDCSQQHAMKMLEPKDIDTTKPMVKGFLDFSQKINTSGRKLIWLNYMKSIEERPWFGNGSNKLMLVTLNPKTREVETIHAHNSYLMLFATHGILLGVFFLLMTLLWWKWKNWSIILIILGYSFFQYGIFWGFSLLDAVFVFVLIAPKNWIASGYSGTDT